VAISDALPLEVALLGAFVLGFNCEAQNASTYQTSAKSWNSRLN